METIFWRRFVRPDEQVDQSPTEIRTQTDLDEQMVDLPVLGEWN